jgi:hypothetical protein
MIMNRFEEFFRSNNNSASISKWSHYFDIYERHLSKYINLSPVILEIGTNEGGGSEMFNYYFNGNCKIVTFDINDSLNSNMKKYNNIKFLQGSQTDMIFLTDLIHVHGKFDIILDDGGHGMDMQIASFNKLYPDLSDNGTYMVEDVHTSYWSGYNGGVGKSGTFIEYTKSLIDKLNVWHWQQTFSQNDLDFCQHTASIHYYDSIVVIEKRQRTDKPLCKGKQANGMNGRIWDDNSGWKNNLKG